MTFLAMLSSFFNTPHYGCLDGDNYSFIQLLFIVILIFFGWPLAPTGKDYIKKIFIIIFSSSIIFGILYIMNLGFWFNNLGITQAFMFIRIRKFTMMIIRKPFIIIET